MGSDPMAYVNGEKWFYKLFAEWVKAGNRGIAKMFAVNPTASTTDSTERPAMMEMNSFAKKNVRL